MLRKITLCLCMLILSITPVKGVELKLAPNASASILIDASTNKVLYASNEQEKLYPASTTKIMTMILMFEAVHNGQLRWDDMLTCSEHASSMGGSQVYLETGEQMCLSDLFKSIAIASANDACVVVGERIAGNHEAFVDMMNEKAKQLKLVCTHFENATGLHDDNHYTCAYDLSIMASYLIEIGGDKLLETTSLYDSYIREGSKKFWLVNTNKLLKSYKGVDGLKTGYTKEAGYCMVVTAKKNGLRLIGVVLKEKEPKVRNNELIQLLDYGFSLFETHILFKTDEVIEKKDVKNGKESKANIVSVKDVIYVKKKHEDINISYTLKYNDLIAPIHKGDIVGTLILKDNKNILGTYELTVDKDIEAMTFIEVFHSYIKLIV